MYSPLRISSIKRERADTEVDGAHFSHAVARCTCTEVALIVILSVLNQTFVELPRNDHHQFTIACID